MSIEKKHSRRDFLRLTATAAIAAGGAGGFGMLQRSENEKAKETWQPAEDATYREELDPPEFLKLKKDVRPYDTSKLEGKSFGYPINLYFDQRGPFKAKSNIDFRYQLAWMWAMKAHDMGIWKEDEDPGLPLVERIMQAAAKNKNDPRMKAIEHIVMSYEPEESVQMSSAYYYHELSDAIGKVRADLDWDKLQHHFHLSGAQTKFLRTCERYLDAETLFAFNLSELMPAQGTLTLDVFDTMLKTAGSEFVYRIPSGGDLLISYGPGQITSQLFKNGKRDKGSLVRMSAVLKKQLLPEDIAQVKGAQHHFASYLDGVFNLILLAKTMSDERAKLLTSEPIGDDIRLFISGAHNNPSAALESFDRFASAHLHTKKHHGNVRPHFNAFTSGYIKEYVERTRVNLGAIRERGGMTLVRN